MIIIQVRQAFHPEYAMVQYEYNGKRFWRCRRWTHPDVYPKQ